jgi:hypothetical protein
LLAYIHTYKYIRILYAIFLLFAPRRVYCRPICDQIRPTLDIDDDDVAMDDDNNNSSSSSNNNKKSSVVRYLHIAEVPDEYTIGIFVFGPHEKIPLHDHPEMCVLSRILYGDLERLSLDLDRKGRTPNDYDFVFGTNSNSCMDTTDEDIEDKDQDEESSSSIRHFLEKKPSSNVPPVENTNNTNTNNTHNESSSSSSVFLAALSRSATWLHHNLYNNNSGSCTMDDESDQQQQQQQKERFPEGTKVAYRNATDVLEAPNVASLYPYEGNLHEFVAGPYGAAVLDVLLPPYDDERKRDCTFYNIRETTIAIQPTTTTTSRGHRGNGVSKATATATFAPKNLPHEALDRSVSPLSSLTHPVPREDTGNKRMRDETNHHRQQQREQQREPCLIVPTGQPENFHCISGRYNDLGEIDDCYDSQYDDD